MNSPCVGCLVAFGTLVVVVAAFFAWGISMDPHRPRLRWRSPEARWVAEGVAVALLALGLWLALTWLAG